jgi:hypothetical protein
MAKFGHGGRLLPRYYDLYQRLLLQFYVLLMVGAMDTRNMWSDFAVNKYLHTVASCWILLTCSYGAQNHEYKICNCSCPYMKKFRANLSFIKLTRV